MKAEISLLNLLQKQGRGNTSGCSSATSSPLSQMAQLNHGLNDPSGSLPMWDIPWFYDRNSPRTAQISLKLSKSLQPQEIQPPAPHTRLSASAGVWEKNSTEFSPREPCSHGGGLGTLPLFLGGFDVLPRDGEAARFSSSRGNNNNTR